MLFVGAIAASALDGVGGIPFMRAVKGRERATMTGVYRTYIDFSDLMPSVVFSIALGFFGLGVVFIILGVWLAHRRRHGVALSAALDVAAARRRGSGDALRHSRVPSLSAAIRDCH